MCARVKTHLVQIDRERGHRLGVVRHVQHQGRLAGHDLKAPGQLHQCQPRTHGLRGDGQAAAQRLEGRQYARRIDQLVGAAQRRVGQRVVAPAAARPAPLLAVTRVVEVAPHQPQIRPDGLAVLNHAARGYGVAHHGGAAGSHDVGFLPADGLAVGAQQFHVVQVDAGDDAAVGVDEVDRVQPASEADLQDDHVQRLL